MLPVFVCVYMCMSMRVYVPLTSFIIPLERGRGADFKLWTQLDHANFADWMSFLPANFIEEISPNPEDHSRHI